jgi:hypothetical protein
MEATRKLAVGMVTVMGTALPVMLLFALGAHAQTDGRPETPYFTGTNPPSGSNDNYPRFLGVAPADTIVTLHNTSDCTGQHVGIGTPDEFANPGIVVRVPDNSTTTLWVHVNQDNVAGRQSHCSVTPITYVERTSRAAALKKCKQKFRGKAKAKKRKQCIKKAKKRPI